jgi:hypothetical protein
MIKRTINFQSLKPYHFYKTINNGFAPKVTLRADFRSKKWTLRAKL